MNHSIRHGLLGFQSLKSICNRRISHQGLRTYASESERPSQFHPAAIEAQERSKPLAVKGRRQPRKHPRTTNLNLPPLKSNPSMGSQIPTDDVVVQKRRLRGVVNNEVVGTRVYLPNIIFIMTRNGTLPGEAYNPYKATFHVPVSLTKNDIKSYLLAVYGVETTYINTEIPHQVDRRSTRIGARHRARFKRAIVGLVQPFYYPTALEDMSPAQRKLLADEQEMRGQYKERHDIMQNVFKMDDRVDEDGIPNTRSHLRKKAREWKLQRERALAQAVGTPALPNAQAETES